MAPQLILLAVVLLLLGLVEPATAAGTGMGFGDGLALFLCFGILIIGVLACLGHHSRRLSAGQF